MKLCFFRILLIALSATPWRATAVGPVPAKIPAIPESIIESFSTFGVDYSIGTAKFLVTAQTPLVDRATAKTIGEANKRMIERYYSNMRNARFGSNQLHASINLAIVAGTVGATSSGIGAPVAIPVNVVASKLNDMARDYLVANQQAQSSAALYEGIKRMTNEQSVILDTLLKEEKYDEAKEHFEQSTGALTTMRDLVDDDPTAKSLFENSITASLRQGSISAISIAARAIERTDNLEYGFSEYTNRFAKFAKSSEVALEDIAVSTRTLRDEANRIGDRVDRLTESSNTSGTQLAVIQQVLFDQHTPTVKLLMLENGAFPELRGEQWKTLRDALQVKVKQQDLLNKTSKYLNYARDLNTIMSSVGVKDPILEQAISHGFVANQVLTQAFGGNYLGAVASMAGLFGGGGSPPDPMAIHMNTIMGAFDAVNTQLNIVLDLQVETLKSIESLATDIEKVRREANARFDRIDFELASLQTRQQRLIWKDLDVCELAYQNQDANHLNSGSYTGGRYDRINRRFRNFDALGKH